jgi:hypothetical protein
MRNLHRAMMGGLMIAVLAVAVGVVPPWGQTAEAQHGGHHEVTDPAEHFAAFGVFGALGASRFLGQLLFEVPATDPLTYVVVLAAALLVGVLAAWIPARRATRIDPVSALRDG